MSVRIDTTEQAEGQLDVDGWQIYRMAVVDGLSGSGAAQLIAAVAQVQGFAASPPLTLGAPHPTVPDARLEQFLPRTKSVGVVEVRLVYKERAGGTNSGSVIKVGASAQQVQTNRDFNGNLMTVSYTPPGGTQQKQSGILSKFAPQTVLTVTRTESAFPGDTARIYVGTVNEAGWAVDPSTQARCWLCTEIMGTSRNRGLTWEVEYSFQYQSPKSLSGPYAGGWDAGLAYIDPQTGRVPPDYTAANGGHEDFFQLYTTENFNVFGFVP